MQITAIRLCLSLIFVGVRHLSLAQMTTERLTAAESLWGSAYRQSGLEPEHRQMQAIDLIVQPDTRDQARIYLLQLIAWRLTDPDLLARRDVVLAALALFDGRPVAALNLLPPVGSLPRHHGLRILELKAQ